jgi:hypothetical protein
VQAYPKKVGLSPLSCSSDGKDFTDFQKWARLTLKEYGAPVPGRRHVARWLKRPELKRPKPSATRQQRTTR